MYIYIYGTPDGKINNSDQMYSFPRDRRRWALNMGSLETPQTITALSYRWVQGGPQFGNLRETLFSRKSYAIFPAWP